jgi:hypothetical protein
MAAGIDYFTSSEPPLYGGEGSLYQLIRLFASLRASLRVTKRD